MADDIAVLGIKVLSDDVVKATKRLDKLEGQSKKTGKASKGLTKGFGALRAAAVAAAAAFAVRGFLKTAGAFESMAVSLETVTGSAEKATQAMDGITEFALNTPFQVSEITQAFIKLKALGIAPTEESLTSFGNTASAMGKSLDQMIEAVADAATGEFERLKEFGIKARSQGENVSFTFQGVTTTVKKSSEEITSYLESIGTEKFGGAMIKQMDTINGKISNLGDAWDNLIVTFARTGTGEAAKGAIGLMVDAVNLLTSGVERLPSVFVAAFAQADKFFIGIKASAQRLSLDVQALWISGETFRERLAQVDAIEEAEKAAADAAATAFIAAEVKKMEAKGSIAEAGKEEVDPVKEEESALDKQFEQDIALFDMQARRIEMAEFEKEEQRRIAEEKLSIENDYYTRLYDMQSGSLKAGHDFAKSIRDSDAKNAVRNGALMLSNAAKHNKAAFEGQKAFALANAVVTLPSAVMKSFENGGGFPWGLIPAGLMLAQGVKQIQQIKSASFGGGSVSAGSISGGGSTSPSAPVASGLPEGSTALPTGEEQRRPQQVSITLEGAGYSKEDVRNLIEQVNDEIEDGAELKVSLA